MSGGKQKTEGQRSESPHGERGYHPGTGREPLSSESALVP
jgi:hypothetical protein